VFEPLAVVHPIVDYPVAVAAVISAVVAIFVGLRKIYRGCAEVFRVQASASKIINAELTPNGGGSLLDKVARIPQIEERLLQNHIQAEDHWTTLEQVTITANSLAQRRWEENLESNEQLAGTLDAHRALVLSRLAAIEGRLARWEAGAGSTEEVS
jgi:hypothetical protein